MSVRKLTKSTFAVLLASILGAFALGLYAGRTGMLVFAVPAALSLAFLFFLVFKRVLDPLLLLTEAMKRARAGADPSALRTLPVTNDELGALTSSCISLFEEVSEVTDNCHEVFASLPVPAIELDADGRVIAINDAAAGCGLHLPAKGERLEELNGLTAAALSGTVEVTSARDDGSALSVLFKAVPLKKKGAVTGSLLVGRDDTRRLEMELDSVRTGAREAETKLTNTIRDLEEFALMTIRRERKMKEIREKLTELREGPNNTKAGA